MARDDKRAVQPTRSPDPRWQERIELAKIAREQGRKAAKASQRCLGRTARPLERRAAAIRRNLTNVA